VKGLVWKPDEAQRVIDFFPAILRLPENVDAGDELLITKTSTSLTRRQPFVLSPFQEFIAGRCSGGTPSKGFRRFRIGYIETGKGQRQDAVRRRPDALPARRGRGARRPGVLRRDDSSTRRRSRSPTPRRWSRLAVAEEAVRRPPSTTRDPKTGSFIRAISSEKKGLDGKRVSACLLEELHEHPTPRRAEDARRHQGPPQRAHRRAHELRLRPQFDLLGPSRVLAPGPRGHRRE
jgi:hypothetical protein